jgi:DNA-binding NarL/FixJ family response regulator
MADKIRLLVIEDNYLLREGITAVLAKQPDFMVIAAPDPGENVLAKITASNTDIVLLDWGLSSQDSLEIVKLIAGNGQKTKVIVMGLFPSHSEVLELIENGAEGFLMKDASADEFVSSIRRVYEGEKVLPGSLNESLFSEIVKHKANDPKEEKKIIESIRMTSRERQVVALIAEGMTNKEIARDLHVSSYTVKSHVHNILEKLTLHNRLQIARYVYDSESDSAARGME